MDEVPVRLCCDQRHWTVQCPDGLTMCCLCFDRFPKSDLSVDDEGHMWDVCKSCDASERAASREQTQ